MAPDVIPVINSERWDPRPDEQPDREVRQATLILRTLRLFEQRGPLSGREALAALGFIGKYGRSPGLSYPLLHQLEQDGYLAADNALPRCYRLTASGRTEAERLAQVLEPHLRARLARLEARLELLSGISSR